MTITLRARVIAPNKLSNIPANKWAVTCHARGPSGQIVAGQMRTTDSWPEAMQQAYKLLNDLDAELMAEVHASRATRRERCERCQFNDMRYGHRYTPDCQYGTPPPLSARDHYSLITPDVRHHPRPAMTTTEATA